LYVHKPEDSFPFILSNMTEKAVTESIAGKGIAQLNMAFASVLLIGLTLFGLFGSFGADDYLTSAMLAPVFMLFVTLVLHFNDLVFLRQRVNRNASNIDVSLKKRHDLLPNLEQIVKSYMSHESEVMLAMTELRTAYSQQDKNNPDSIGNYMLAEHNAVGHVIARMEAYPDLKASKEATMLMRTMVALENEIALMREGYNNSVETYNTRIETLPDMIFAKAFGFSGRNYIRAEVGETVLPEISSLNDAEEAPALPVAQAVRPASMTLMREPLTAEQMDASAAIYALLINPEADVRSSQLDMILERHDETMVERTKLHVGPIDDAAPNDMERLKQAESWYEALVDLDDEQYRTFTAVLRELVEADDIISLFECALQHSITHRLDLPRSGAVMPPTRYDDIELVAGQVSVLLSTLMQMEDDVDETGAGAFQTGLAALNYDGEEPIDFLGADKCTLSSFNAALDDLRHATGSIKAQVFSACSSAVGDNADYTYDQALLLAMIADGFNMERPDWI
jgi:hypothetical protein